MIKTFIYIIVNLIFISYVYGQNFPNLNFELLSKNTVLPTNEIFCVTQDLNGALWFSTETMGVLKYDGNKFENILFDKLGNGKPLLTEKMTVDKSNNLWVNSFNGLYKYNIKEKTFKKYKNSQKDIHSLLTNDRPHPYCDRQGRIWISGWNGFQQYDDKNDRFITYSLPDIKNPDWQKHKLNTSFIFQSSDDVIWVGSFYGLYKVDTIEKKLIPYFTGKYSNITSITEDKAGLLWLTFWGEGIQTYNRLTGEYTRIELNQSLNVCASAIKYNDINNVEWICFSSFDNFILINPITKEYKKYPKNDNEENTLKGSGFSNIFKDRDNNLWIPSTAGINVCYRRNQFINNLLLYKEIAKDNPMIYGFPRTLFRYDNKFTMPTWFHGNTYTYNENWNLLSIEKQIDKKLNHKNAKGINHIKIDKEGKTWYATNNGLYLKLNNQYFNYIPEDRMNVPEGDFDLNSIVFRSDGKLWLKYRTRGLYLFDPKTGKHIKNYFDDYGSNTGDLEYDREGVLWLTCGYGLYRFHEDMDSFINIRFHHSDKELEDGYNDNPDLIIDKNGIFWLASISGLVRYDKLKNQYKFITGPYNFHNELIERISIDGKGTIWSRVRSGIYGYNESKNKFYHYTTKDGLHSLYSINYGVFEMKNDSILLVAITGGIIELNTYQLTNIKNKVSIYISTILGDDNVKYIYDKKSIFIRAGTQKIEIKFGINNYEFNTHNILSYRMINDVSTDWIKSPDGNITLISDGPGNYTLQLKGENLNVYDNEAVETIEIIVLPKWYQTVLFKLSILLFIAGLLFYLNKLRINTIRKDATYKQLISQTEMSALKAQMNPHFIFNCINSIDALIQSNDKYNATVYLNKFAKLIRNILESSKQNLVSFSKDMETMRLYLELEELRNEGKFKIVFDIDPRLEDSNYKVPPLIIQPYIENAIIHGLRNKQTNDGLLSISAHQKGDLIYYEIKDNGIGRKAASNFHQVKELSYGMQLSSDRIRLFNNDGKENIEVIDLYESEIATGTLIKIKLKIE